VQVEQQHLVLVHTNLEQMVEFQLFQQSHQQVEAVVVVDQTQDHQLLAVMVDQVVVDNLEVLEDL
jgi:hypothetical protein